MVIKKSFRNLISKYNSQHNTDYCIKNDIVIPTLSINDPITKNAILISCIDYKIVGKVYRNSLSTFLCNCMQKPGIGCLSLNSFSSFLLTLNSQPKITLKIWPPNKIKYAYLKDNYYAIRGQLGSSCMRGKDMQRSLNFYEKQGVQIVVAVDENNKIYARALLWDKMKVKSSKGEGKVYTYMDRIYASNNEQKMFETLAIKNKWLKYEGTSHSQGNNDYYIDNINIEGITHLPWSDTFRYLWYKDKIITGGHQPPNLKFLDAFIECSTTADRGYHRQLDSNSVQEALSNSWVSKKDCIKVKQYNGFVLKTNIVEINKKYYSKHDKKLILTTLDEFIFKSNMVHESITQDTMDKNKGVKLPYYTGVIHKKNIKKVNGCLYHKKDPDLVIYKKKWYHITQCFRNRAQQLIPKQIAISVYRLKKTLNGEIKYEQDYCYVDYTSFVDLIVTEKHAFKNGSEYSYNTITPLILDDDAYKLVRKHNKKYYLKKQCEITDKNQMEFSFMRKRVKI